MDEAGARQFALACPLVADPVRGPDGQKSFRITRRGRLGPRQRAVFITPLCPAADSRIERLGQSFDILCTTLDIGTLSVDPHHRKPANAPNDPAIPGTLFRPILGLVGIGLLACTIWALGLTDLQMQDGLSLPHCSAVTNDHERLACFDKLAEPRPPARGAFAILHNPHGEPQ